jgi:hypothetical protein
MSGDADDQHLRRYLLGDLTGEARDALEARYFAEDDIFARLLAEEDALSAAYLRGQLSPAERALFEKSVLSSAGGRRRVRITADLVEHARARLARRPRRGMALRPAWAAAAAAVFVLVALALGWRMRGRELDRSATPHTAAQPSTMRTPAVEPPPAGTGEVAGAPRAVASGSVLTVVLASGLTREVGAAHVVAVPPKITTLHLQLVVPSGDYARYRLSIQTPEGLERAAEDGLLARRVAARRIVEADVPTSLLDAGTHIAVLSGVGRDGGAETVAEYAFRVTRTPDPIRP